MHKEVRSIVIWDAEGMPSGDTDLIILWRNFNSGNTDKIISISKLVEDDSDSLRSRYLSWIYELGVREFRGKKVIDILEIRPGFSFWWMTLIAQRTNAFESPYVLDVVKLMALEDLLKRYPLIEKVELFSNNVKLINTLKIFTKKTKYSLKTILPKQQSADKLNFKQLYRKLPYPLQAFLYIWKYFFNFYTLVKTNPEVHHKEGERHLSVVDILVHLNKDTFSTGKFHSNYWTNLVDILGSSDIKTNWIHSFYKHDSVKSPRFARKLIDAFNNAGEANHSLVEAHLTLKILLTSGRDYLKIALRALNLKGIKKHFRPSTSKLNFWLFFEDDWNNSLFGTEAMINCLRVNLFEDIFKNMPYQETGIYLQENQPWEMALIYSWKNAAHGKLIGAPHTTVRHWDLRYFLDKRSYLPYRNNFLVPDIVAVNGNVAYKTYVDAGYPPSSIARAEALRYLHLLNNVGPPAEFISNTDALKVLVCGDILEHINKQMFDWLTGALSGLPENVVIKVKPHPARSIDPNDYPSLNLQILNDPFDVILAQVDVAFTSNMTSAAVDAYYSGVPVVTMLNGDSFNISPLRGLGGVAFVTNPTELGLALVRSKGQENYLAEPYFFLDKHLPRWRGLLSI